MTYRSSRWIRSVSRCAEQQTQSKISNRPRSVSVNLLTEHCCLLSESPSSIDMVNVGTRVIVLLFFTLVVIIPSSVEQSRQKFKCPRRCRCFSSSGSNGWEVDCGNKNLKDLPNIPRNTATL